LKTIITVSYRLTDLVLDDSFHNGLRGHCLDCHANNTSSCFWVRECSCM